jgi:hypothetical protein
VSNLRIVSLQRHQDGKLTAASSRGWERPLLGGIQSLSKRKSLDEAEVQYSESAWRGVVRCRSTEGARQERPSE